MILAILEYLEVIFLEICSNLRVKNVVFWALKIPRSIFEVKLHWKKLFIFEHFWEYSDLLILNFLLTNEVRFFHFSAYHGHLLSMIDISPYKFKHMGPGAHKEHVHIVRIDVN